MEDREGNLWVGTETGGLHILRDARFRSLGAHEGLSSDATTTVVEDGAGTLWVGTGNSGLNAVRRGTDDAFTSKNYSVHDGLLSDVILSLASASNGDLGVGTRRRMGWRMILCDRCWWTRMARCGLARGAD
jgi:ligand-binding sensor domain-containing protein